VLRLSKAGAWLLLILLPTAVCARAQNLGPDDPIAPGAREGHTDGKGNAGYNQKLSEQRAASVKKWLLGDGVVTPMMTRGYGKTRPIAPNAKPNGADDPVGRQKNRRVEITVET
jgi:outer membrane protein OmpA-like peptidoglycan-associated protein